MFFEKVGIKDERVSSTYIITYTSFFENIVMEEICNVDGNVELKKNISPTLALITSRKSQEDFLNMLNNQSPTFIKHIMPVMEVGDKFAVQCRIVEGGFSWEYI